MRIDKLISGDVVTLSFQRHHKDPTPRFRSAIFVRFEGEGADRIAIFSMTGDYAVKYECRAWRRSDRGGWSYGRNNRGLLRLVSLDIPARPKVSSS